jgi:exodeoxyribonuclease VII large subunit
MDNDALLSSVCVRGEISNLKYHSSGHVYFTLKDEDAELSAVMFRSSAQSLRFVANNGMKVRAYGRISLYEKSGKCQMYVSAMVDDGIGALQIEYQRLLKKLTEEGLFAEERKRSLPKIPSCIGIITSPTGAAIRDMINVTGRRWPATKIILYPSLVQGADAPESLCRGIEMLNVYAECDVIIIGRGGGSIEDLWAFNDERVVRALADSRIPTISAVGHETDFTLCDFVADCRAPTPSAAAEIAVPDRSEYMQRIDDLFERINLSAKRIINDKKNALNLMSKGLERCSPAAKLNAEKKTLSNKSDQLRGLIGTIYGKNRSALESISGRLAVMNPLAVLGRGYSVAKSQEGRVISSVDSLACGDEISICFVDGEAVATVSNIRSNLG